MAYDPIDLVLAGRAFHISAVVDATPGLHSYFGLSMFPTVGKFALITHADLHNSGYIDGRAHDFRFTNTIVARPYTAKNGGRGYNKRPGGPASEAHLVGGGWTSPGGMQLVRESWQPAGYSRESFRWDAPILLLPGMSFWCETAESNRNLVIDLQWIELPLSDLPELP